jgi:hypothetical protein
MPYEDGEYVDVFEPHGCEGDVSMVTQSLNNIVKEHISLPDRKALVLTGDDLTRMRRLKERNDVLRKRYLTYNNAFVLAVEERLREFMETQAVAYTRYCNIMSPCAFLFSNEGRRYLVISNSDNHHFTWFDGVLFHDEASSVLAETTCED